MYIQKVPVISKKTFGKKINFFFAILKIADEKSRIRIRNKMSRIRNTAFFYDGGPCLGLQKTCCMGTPASFMASPTSLACRLPITVRGQSRANPSGPARRSGTLATKHRKCLGYVNLITII
jgi:hypothetical protein